MGATPSKGSSSCLVRNQSGHDVRVTYWRASGPDGRRATDAGEAFIEHGAERPVEAGFHDEMGMHVAIRIGTDDERALRVPNSSVVILRSCRGEAVIRIWREDRQEYAALEYVDAQGDAAQLAGLQTSGDSESGPTSCGEAARAPVELAATVAGAESIGKGESQLVGAQGGEAQLAGAQGSEGPDPTQCGEEARPRGAGAPGEAQPAAAQGSEGPGPAQCSEGARPRDAGAPGDTCGAALSGASGAALGHVPCECLCPISHEPFVDPVLAADGFTYERACIEEWWRRRGPKSPMTGQDVASTALAPNLAVRKLMSDHRAHALDVDRVAPPAGGSAATAASLRGAAPAPDAATESIGFYEEYLPALAEMFECLDVADLRGVCGALARDGVEDIDTCVRRLLQHARTDGETAVVSLAPVCCDAGPGDADAAAAASLGGDPACSVPDTWTDEQEGLFAELLDLHFPPVRAQKAIEMGCATDLEDAVVWLERHQGDDDIDTPVEVLRERENVELALDVLRIATIPAVHRLACFRALHQALGRILADPESDKLRKIRLHNPKFRECIGRFPQAVALLKRIGFVKGDYWVSAYQREPCLEFRFPVNSDNLPSQRFVRAYTLLDEVLQDPDAWLPTVGESLPEVHSEWSVAESALHQSRADGDDRGTVGASSREYRAELHERRIRDPRGFQEAMRAAGKAPNRVVASVQRPAPAAAGAAELSGAAALSSSSSSAPARQYRPLSERYRGKREFNLQDIEAMRVEDAIAGCPRYAQAYDSEQGQARSYGDLVTRMYDPQYLGRKALDDTNVFRGQEQRPPLRWSQALSDIAADHARQMARGEMPFSHQGFDDRVRRYPFPYMTAGENLAYNSGVSDAAGQAVQGWIKSPGHRKNLLGEFNLCGIGVARSGSGEFFFTQLFARTPGALC